MKHWLRAALGLPQCCRWRGACRRAARPAVQITADTCEPNGGRTAADRTLPPARGDLPPGRSLAYALTVRGVLAQAQQRMRQAVAGLNSAAR